MRRVILKSSVIFLGLLAAFLSVSSAEAAPISIDITAQISSVDDHDGFLSGKIGVNDIIHGRYIYETTTVDTNGSSEVGDYQHTTAPFGITLEVNGYLFQTDPDIVDFLVELCNDHHGNHDAYLLRSYNNLFDITVPLSNPEWLWSRENHISWQLDDFGSITHTALASTALPTIPPVLSDWPHNALIISSEQYSGGSQRFFIMAYVTSAVLSPASIPEPTTMLLLGLGLIGVAGVRNKFQK